MSGTSGIVGQFSPAIAELVIDAYERCGKLGVELTQQSQMISSARRSLNLLLSSWANKGIQLFTVDEVAQFMPQGVSLYFDSTQCVDVLADSIIVRQYLMGAPVNVAPAFTTVAGSAAVTIAGFTGTPIAGGYVTVGVPVSVGGIVLQGIYQVVSVPTSGQAIVAASQAATSSTTGGVVPIFTTSVGIGVVTVTLPAHGLVSGQSFQVQVPVSVGGITLTGPYIVQAPVTTNTFAITAANVAGSTASASENGGLAQLATQSQISNAVVTSPPTDIRLYPISRTDYYSIPQKTIQGRPTSIWVNRQIIPQLNIWPVPDQNGPYELRYKRSRYVADADLVSGQQLAVPQRFLEAFVSGLAASLAMKFAAERAVPLKAYADQMWSEAAATDSERVPLYVAPDLTGYYSP